MADATAIWMAMDGNPTQTRVAVADTLSRALSLWKQGDVAAFETIVELLNPIAFRVAFRLLGNRQDAEEAAQETFWRLYRSGLSIRNPEGLPAWVYRTTVNVARNLRKRRPGHATVALDQIEWQSPDSQTGADRSLLLREEIARALEQIGSKEREAPVLRDIEGLEIAEVAAAMGVFAVTVRTHLSWARLKVRHILKARGIQP